MKDYILLGFLVILVSVAASAQQVGGSGHANIFKAPNIVSSNAGADSFSQVDASSATVSTLTVSGTCSGCSAVGKYAEIYATGNSTTLTLSSNGSYYQLTDTHGATSGDLSGWTHSGGTLTAGSSSGGTYLLIFSGDMKDTTSTTSYEHIGIFVNDTMNTSNCHHEHRYNSVSYFSFVMMTCIIDIANSATVKVKLNSDTNTQVVLLENWNLSLSYIGP